MFNVVPGDRGETDLVEMNVGTGILCQEVTRLGMCHLHYVKRWPASSRKGK